VIRIDLKVRLCDLLLSLCASPVIMIVFAIVTPIMLIMQGRPIFFVSSRINPNGEFSMVKLRTMKVNSPLRETGTEMTKYITLVGRFLRLSSLDELPQFINVLNGTMSIVGPRPCLPSQTHLIDMRSQTIVGQCFPGITGLAQVRGRDFISDRHKVRYDRFYAENYSITFYFWIIIQTIKVVVSSKRIRY
jgi:O-antigen biosynthesis protein WbqP